MGTRTWAYEKKRDPHMGTRTWAYKIEKATRVNLARTWEPARGLTGRV
jgi:hypothetical protein